MNQYKSVYILGAGNQARETLVYYKDLGRQDNIKGLLVHNLKRRTFVDDIEVLDASIIDTLDKNIFFISSIGSPLRKKWITQLEIKDAKFDTLIHPKAYVGKSVKIGDGCIIAPNSSLTRSIKLGKHSIINIGCNITHDCTIGDYVTICPGANIGGNVTIGDCCWIGLGSSIKQGVSIGKGAFIGIGAVVVNDIPDCSLAIGIPAKPRRIIKDSDWENGSLV